MYKDTIKVKGNRSWYTVGQHHITLPTDPVGWKGFPLIASGRRVFIRCCAGDACVLSFFHKMCSSEAEYFVEAHKVDDELAWLIKDVGVTFPISDQVLLPMLDAWAASKLTEKPQGKEQAV